MYCRSENLITFLSLHKNNIPKVSHYNTFYFLLRNACPRYVNCLFTNIQKQEHMLKISIIFKKNTNFAGKITRALLEIRMRNFQIFMYSNIQEDFQMRKCTFKMETRKLQRNFLSLFVLALHFEIIENIIEN